MAPDACLLNRQASRRHRRRRGRTSYHPIPVPCLRSAERQPILSPTQSEGSAMNLFDLTGKVAVITGGNGGIGLGMAQGIASCGANIAIIGRNAEKAEAALATLRDIGIEAA